MSDIILPDDFKRPRYIGGQWLSHYTRWSEDDKTLLMAACSLQIRPAEAASTFGRCPTSLAHKALDLGIRIPREWMALIRTKSPRKRVVRELLSYPYITKFDDRHADLVAVHGMVSNAMPGREDVCQDIMLALWESRTSIEALRCDPEALRAFIREFRKASYERSGYNVESMDEKLADGTSKYDGAKYQRVLIDNDEAYLEEYILNGTKHRVTHDSVIDRLGAEEESLGVPVAFWGGLEGIA